MASGRILALEDTNFNEVVKQTSIPVLVDFWAEWCGPCKMIAPIVDDIAEEFEGKLKACKLNVDENPNIQASLKINSIPTLVIFKDGKEMERSVGYKTKEEIRRWLTKHL